MPRKRRKKAGYHSLEEEAAISQRKLPASLQTPLASATHLEEGNAASDFRCIHKWHRRVGHASFCVLKKMPEFARGDAADATQPDDHDSQANVPFTNSSQPNVPSSQAADAVAGDNDEDEDKTEEEWTVVPRCSKRTTKRIPPKRYS